MACYMARKWKKQRANFTIKNYGSDEKAKQKAIEYRKAMNGITGSTNGTRKISV